MNSTGMRLAGTSPAAAASLDSVLRAPSTAAGSADRTRRRRWEFIGMEAFEVSRGCEADHASVSIAGPVTSESGWKETAIAE